MTTGPPQADRFVFAGNHPGARRYLNLNQNLNRGPRFATLDILNSVELDVNPVFSTLKVRLCKPVPCPRVQGAYGEWASALFLPAALQRPELPSRAILSPAKRLESINNPMPRKRRNEDLILRRIAYSFRPSRSQRARQSIALGIG